MSVDLVRRAAELANRGEPASDEELAQIYSPDVVADFSVRVFNPDVYRGYDGLRRFYDEMHEIWEHVSFTVREIVEDGNRYLVLSDVRSRAGGSGIEIEGTAAAIFTVAGGRVKHFVVLAQEQADRDEALAALRDPG